MAQGDIDTQDMSSVLLKEAGAISQYFNDKSRSFTMLVKHSYSRAYPNKLTSDNCVNKFLGNILN